MKILYLTNGFPFPLTSGYLRHYFLIKGLARRHEVTLISLVDATFQQEHAEALAPFTKRVIPIPAFGKPNSIANKVIRQLQHLVGTTPAIKRMCAAVKDAARETSFDVAIFCGRETLPAVESLSPIPVIADVCDAASVRIRGRMPYASFWRRAWLRFEHARMLRLESSLIGSVAHTLFASYRDRDALLSDHAVNATVVPNGVDLDYWKRSTNEPDKNTIVFTGAMNYRPNIDAALHLIREVLPEVRLQIPEARLLIVGRDPSVELQQAGGQPGVTVTGFVDDVRPYLEQAAVFAAPLRFGAGIQNKVLEAMAMELPIVTTAVAADGLRTEGGIAPPISIAPVSEFAEYICRQLSENRSSLPIHTESRDYVRRHFSWESSGEKIEHALGMTLQLREGNHSEDSMRSAEVGAVAT